ncbi:MAG TPA: sigma-54 dependent transcriptional regulator [Planctomycetaceae bacterium]|nr:sigma-54 dependent transcriptional regulator [Planctomycetaceae bacterium]
MPLPTVVLASRDTLFRQALEAALQCTITLTEDISRAVGLAQETDSLCVVDLRPVVSGGHLEAHRLEGVLDSTAGLRLAIITAEPCPEPLDRLCVCHGLERFSGPSAAKDVAAYCRNDAAPSQTEAAPGVVLNGLTRKFETRTSSVVQMLGDLEIAARHDVTVLLIGETGAGKTFVSRLIHEISPRHDEPFLPVACGALPTDLLESELFGHVRGAFTSAHADKEGRFLAAGRGTILLDEIDVLGPEQQVKLLRVIESGEFEPVGSNRTHRSQARLIVASNVDLQPLVQQGRFRPDLYYRLNQLKFVLPPLRERRPDILSLAERFIAELSRRHGVAIERVESGFYAALEQYSWPGNVRELENVLRRAVIYCRDGVLRAEQLPTSILGRNPMPVFAGGGSDEPMLTVANESFSSLSRQIASTERDIIEQALSQNNRSRTGAAKALGISRVTLYNKMRKYGIG